MIRTVGLMVGHRSLIVPLRMELDPDWVHLRPVPGKQLDLGHRALLHLHIQYDILGVPHRFSTAKDAQELEYFDSISLPRTLADDYLFVRLGGLADEADPKNGIH